MILTAISADPNPDHLPFMIFVQIALRCHAWSLQDDPHHGLLYFQQLAPLKGVLPFARRRGLPHRGAEGYTGFPA